MPGAACRQACAAPRKQMSVRRSVVVSKDGRLLGRRTDPPRAAVPKKPVRLMSVHTSGSRGRQLQAGCRAYEGVSVG